MRLDDDLTGADDIVVNDLGGECLIECTGLESSRLRCEDAGRALQLAQELAARRCVDVWFRSDDGAMWSVRRYRLTEDADVSAQAVV